MPIELNTLSQSSLQDYNDCPRRFELRYLQHLAYPAIETEPALENEKHQREGENFHRLVQQYFIGIPEKQLAKTTKHGQSNLASQANSRKKPKMDFLQHSPTSSELPVLQRRAQSQGF